MAYVCNVGLSLNNGDYVAIISCKSDYSISRAKISSIATSYFKSAITSGCQFNEAVRLTVDGVKHDCKIDAEAIFANITYSVSDKRSNRRYG